MTPNDRCTNIKVDAELVRKAKVVATLKRMTLSKYITELVRPHVENDLARVAQGLGSALAGNRSSAEEDESKTK